MTQHDDSATADDGKTAMRRYVAWHEKSCRCNPIEHDDAAQDNTHTDADTRRDNNQETNEK